MNWKNRFTNRRQFLVGSGTSLVLPPLLSLMSPLARAQVALPKRRFVVMVGLYGIDQHQLYPVVAQSNMTEFKGPLHTWYKPLADFKGKGPISRLIDTDFETMFPKMNLMQGLSMTAGLYAGHNTTVLAGVHSFGRFDEGVNIGRTLDVVMEKYLYQAGEVPHKAIRLVCGGHDEPFSYDTVGGPKISDSMQGDVQLFNKLFPTTFTPPGGTPAPPSDDKLIVDKVHSDLKALESPANTRLSSEDRNVLSRYIASMYDLQLKVNASAGAPTCQRPSQAFKDNLQAKGGAYYLPDYPGWNTNLNVSTMFDNINEMIKLAFICDLTRVVFIGNERCNMDAPNTIDPHHDCPGGSDGAAEAQKWGLKKFLKLAKSLDSASLLDSSLLFFTNEMGDWTTGHGTYNMPAVTFGSCGGYFRTGNYVDFRQRPMIARPDDFPGRPYKQLLQSIMLAMGVPQDEYKKYGDGNGYGEFRQGIDLFGKVYPDLFKAYAAEHNGPLPFVTI